MNWIADTNVISETNGAKINAKFRAWLEAQPRKELFTTTVNIAELRFGILELKDTERALALHDWLNSTVAELFASHILEVDERALVRW